MLVINDDWEFSAIGVYNYKKPGKLDHLFAFIRENHNRFEGDIVESGVFRGASLVALGMLLKELGSEKKVFGFDSFSGFPAVYHAKDGQSEFESMFEEGVISASHVAAVKRNAEWRKRLTPSVVPGVGGTSTSLDFSSTSIEHVKRKIDVVGLDNVLLIAGPFSETMVPNRKLPQKIFAGIVDCDLYQSYLNTYAFMWPRMEQGAMVYLDEYYSLKFPGARRATNEFISGRSARLELAPTVSGEFERWHLIKG